MSPQRPLTDSSQAVQPSFNLPRALYEEGKKAAKMTTYIPSLTLPSQVFAQPALSILLPVGVGLGLGYFVTRTIIPVFI